MFSVNLHEFKPIQALDCINLNMIIHKYELLPGLIGAEFTLSEIVELKKSAVALIKLAKEISNNSLLLMIEDFRLLYCLAEKGADSKIMRLTDEHESRLFLQFGKVFWVK